MNLSSLIQVQPETRNHQGYFIPEETFFLVEETPSGWAKICTNNRDDGFTHCHLVNPDDIVNPSTICIITESKG